MKVPAAKKPKIGLCAKRKFGWVVGLLSSGCSHFVCSHFAHFIASILRIPKGERRLSETHLVDASLQRGVIKLVARRRMSTSVLPPDMKRLRSRKAERKVLEDSVARIEPADDLTTCLRERGVENGGDRMAVASVIAATRRNLIWRRRRPWKKVLMVVLTFVSFEGG